MGWDNFYTPYQRRMARRFRHHINRHSNPYGRVLRLPCFNCKNILRQSDAHHIDYAKWYVVVWVCSPCHRLVERGLVIPARAVCDYGSLLLPHSKPMAHVENGVNGDDPFVTGETPF